MRRAYDNEIITDDNKKIVGINLGADFTSEHEWGIKGIHTAFNIDTKLIGIDGRTINHIPTNLIFQSLTIDKRIYYFLGLLYDMYFYYRDDKKINKKDIDNFELYPCGDKDIFTVWDERSFGILVNDKYKDEITDLYEAFKNKDVAIGVGHGHVFKNGGLTITIKSRLPEEVINNIKEKDQDYNNLQKASEKTGIHKILEKAGKRYFALSPRWKDDNKKEVIFWLNPYDQDIYNFGWFTIQDLIDWSKDKGKIIMKKQTC